MITKTPRSFATTRLAAAVACALGLSTLACESEPTSVKLDPRQQPPSEDAAAVQAWLDQRFYETWEAEPFAHISKGPHFGYVRTYVNDAAFEGLTSGAASLPRGAVAVKVVYGVSLAEVQGYALSYKIAEESAQGDGWYWFERFDGNEIMSARGASTFCAECHVEAPNVDLIKTVFQ
jgi:hypothetical protein